MAGLSAIMQCSLTPFPVGGDHSHLTDVRHTIHMHTFSFSEGRRGGRCRVRQRVKSRSLDLGHDSIWKLPFYFFAGERTHHAQEEDVVGAVEGAKRSEWMWLTRDEEGGVTPLVSAEHQLNWFLNGCKRWKQQFNFHPYNRRRNDTLHT